jgi:hypothetical protein
LESATFNESEMALFFECMLECARKVIDTADIVRDGDLSTVDGSFDSSVSCRLQPRIVGENRR